MARPSRNSGEVPAQQRIKDALWELVQEKHLEGISIDEITKRAHCNRGTFYYYFADKYDLIGRVVRESIPQSLPQIVFNIMLSEGGAARACEIVEDNREAIDKICILLNTSAAEYVRRQVREEAAAIWQEVLGVDMTAGGNVPILFEFVVNGLLGVFAFRGSKGCEPDIITCLQTLTPEIPKAFMKCLERCNR